MKLEWLDRYRDLVEGIILFANQYSSIKTKEVLGTDVLYSFEQIQIIEYLVENEELKLNMRGVAERLGLKASAFTKLVNRLEDKGLLEKYRTPDNQKNIVVLVSDKGKKLYTEYCDNIAKKLFEGMFQVGSEVSDEELRKFTRMIQALTQYEIKRIPEGNELIPIVKNKGNK